MSQPFANWTSSWPEPNYVNPETRVPLVVGWSISLSILGVAATIARFHVKVISRRTISKDDFFVGFATVACSIIPGGQPILMLFQLLALVITICECASTRFISGYHSWDIPPAKILDFSTEKVNFWINLNIFSKAL